MDNLIPNNHSLDTKTTNKILKIINLFYNIKLEEYNIIKNDIIKNIKKLNNVLLEKKNCYCISCLFKYLATLIS